MPGRPVHTGIHSPVVPFFGAPTICQVCGLSMAAVAGYQCSGIRNILGRPTQDLPDRGIASEPRLDDGAAGSSASPVLAVVANGSSLQPAAPRSGRKRRGISPASPQQRAHVKAKACIVTGDDSLVHPAHVIPRSLLTIGQDDPRAVVPLRPDIHRLYDSTAGYDLLPHLEPHFRVELAWAVERFGLLRTLEQVTGQRWVPVESVA